MNVVEFKNSMKKVADDKGVDIDQIYMIYLMESFLERVAISNYKENFILKGGFLLASIFDINLRTTRDIDATIKGVAVDEEFIKTAISDITSVDLGDNVEFLLPPKIKYINDSSDYQGYKVKIEVMLFNKIKNTLTLDLTVGDVITPNEIKFNFERVTWDSNIKILAYNINTIIAEKYSSLLAFSVDNTRMRDYYDLYMIYKFEKIDLDLWASIEDKVRERKYETFLERRHEIIDEIKRSESIKDLWKDYQGKYSYAKDVSFDMIMEAIDFYTNYND